MSKKPVEVSEERLVEEGEVAGDYLEQLLDILCWQLIIRSRTAFMVGAFCFGRNSTVL